MALQTTRLVSGYDDRVYVAAIYDDANDLLSHLIVHNDLEGAVLVIIFDSDGAELRRRTFQPGDHILTPPNTLPAERLLRWRRKASNFSVALVEW